MVGTYSQVQKTIELTMGPWIDQPEGYGAATLVGKFVVASEPRKITGRFGYPRCTTFDVTQISSGTEGLGDMPRYVRARFNLN
ncbi:MAG TPA: hypothetical protein VJ890_01690 [Vineibacter sp.]|nr:hypothetical protein [Vineibacter sp.]